jgi:hypothetical protein
MRYRNQALRYIQNPTHLFSLLEWLARLPEDTLSLWVFRAGFSGVGVGAVVVMVCHVQ